MGSPSKRVNWSGSDRDMLVSLVAAKHDIIENNETNTKSILAKNAAWEEIADSFNQRAVVKRNIKQLREQYKQLKANMKKKSAEEKVS